MDDSLYDMKRYLNGDAFQDCRVDQIGVDFMTNEPVYITNHVCYEEPAWLEPSDLE